MGTLQQDACSKQNAKGSGRGDAAIGKERAHTTEQTVAPRQIILDSPIEAAVKIGGNGRGLPRIERTPDGDLYASVTLPNLIVGTVGGGTYLPTAQECLGLLGCVGTGKASKLAEICAVVALAGELAIVGAMASGNFASAHAAAGRRASTNGGGAA